MVSSFPDSYWNIRSGFVQKRILAIRVMSRRLARTSRVKSGSRNALHVWTRGFVVHFVAPIDCFRPFHLYDRVGNPLLTHNDRLKIPKIPAMLELCIQEGFDLKEIGMLDKAKGSPYIHDCRADHRI